MSFNEWTDGKLDDVVEILSGYAFKSKEFIDKGVPVIKIKNIVPPNIDFSDAQYVSEEMYKEKIRYALNYNDILISMTGSNINQINSAVGKVGRVRCKDTKLLLNQRVGKVYVKDENKYSNDFIYYYLTQENVRYDLASSAGGSANQANINPKNIKDLKISIPPIEEQKAIAKILSDLDNKIEVNNKINKRLEDMAQAIFKQWFVDFEFPNEEGKPYKSSGGEMVESEFGMIPDGWEIVKLEDVCKSILRGLTPKYDVISEIKVLNQKVNKGNILEKQYFKYLKEGMKIPKEKYANKWDILLNSLGQGTLGRVHLYKENTKDVIVDQHISIIRVDIKELAIYLYNVLNTDKYKHILDGLVSGSTGMQMLNISKIRELKVIKPKSEIINYISGLVNVYESIQINIIENEKLSQLRNTLLPKLMSGEIGVQLDK